MRLTDLDDKLIYKKAASEQMIFVRDTICMNLLKTHAFVISTHYSKSCKLPVYFIQMRNGIKLIMRCNFYDWKVSVEIPEEYPCLPFDYLPQDCLTYSMVENKNDKIHSCYLEGFKEEWCYDAYDPAGNHKFTIEVPNNYCLFVIIHLLKHAYPDIEFNVDNDKRTVEEIKQSIDSIFDNNGFNDIYERENFGKVFKERQMSSYDILWSTYCKIDKLRSDKIISYDDFDVCCDDPQKFADIIVKFPNVHKEFLFEESVYNEHIELYER